MHFTSSSRARMHMTDASEPARPCSLQAACMDSGHGVSVGERTASRRWAHAPRPSSCERVTACGRKVHVARM
eukprot:1375933-Pleurochrysis_carterae.AAC.1